MPRIRDAQHGDGVCCAFAPQRVLVVIAAAVIVIVIVIVIFNVFIIIHM